MIYIGYISVITTLSFYNYIYSFHHISGTLFARLDNTDHLRHVDDTRSNIASSQSSMINHETALIDAVIVDCQRLVYAIVRYAMSLQ